jgi:peptidoglycan/xylan/chitin deacetylase (PgdA/CDA1 family)
MYMTKVERRLKQSIQYVALATGLSAWLAKRRPVRRVIMLHGVGGSDLRASDFRRAMAWLKQNFRVQSLDSMVRAVVAGTPPSLEGDVAITFDDGLRNQMKIAYPILQEFNIPATFFVCPELISGNQWLWNHEARARLHRLSSQQCEEWALANYAPSSEVERIIDWMKTLPIQVRETAAASLRDSTSSFNPTPEEREAYDLLTWGEIAALDRTLITIGSHTLSHPILPTLSDAQIQHELQASRDILASTLDRDIDLFCYPNGSTDARVREIVEQVYRAAVTTEEGFVVEDTNPFAMPRIPISASLPLFAWRQYRPSA